MSRAFIREPEPGEPRCPGCETPGQPVSSRTLEVHLPAALRQRLSGTVHYCARPECRTGYFDAWGGGVPADQIQALSYPKDPQGPICPCFRVPAAWIVAEAREGRKERVRELLERARGPEARCWERCPDGQSCVPQLMRLFREAYESR